MASLAQSFWFMIDAGASKALSVTNSAPVIQISTSPALTARDRSINVPAAFWLTVPSASIRSTIQSASKALPRPNASDRTWPSTRTVWKR